MATATTPVPVYKSRQEVLSALADAAITVDQAASALTRFDAPPSSGTAPKVEFKEGLLSYSGARVVKKTVRQQLMELLPVARILTLVCANLDKAAKVETGIHKWTGKDGKAYERDNDKAYVGPMIVGSKQAHIDELPALFREVCQAVQAAGEAIADGKFAV